LLQIESINRSILRLQGATRERAGEDRDNLVQRLSELSRTNSNQNIIPSIIRVFGLDVTSYIAIFFQFAFAIVGSFCANSNCMRICTRFVAATHANHHNNDCVLLQEIQVDLLK
jgi:hypothetical protein